MEKTIEQWLQEELTHEQFENAKKCKIGEWSVKVDLLSKAIIYGFYWSKMPEGSYYWNNLCEKIITQGL